MKKIKEQFQSIAFKLFPQSFLIRKPLYGALSFFIVLFVFVMVYHPLEVHKSGYFSFNLTMLAYCAIITLFELLTALLLSRNKCFIPKNNWRIINELLSILILLIVIGISTYLAGFVMESTTSRLNFSTFFDSFYKGVFIGFVPVTLPSLLNIRYAFAKETFQNYEVKTSTASNEALINIESKVKKEQLSFLPSEFIYAESEGNYVRFFLFKDEKLTNVIIRNTITEIESQLSSVPYFMRTHRAYIVNLHKITSRKGNALGYQLILEKGDKSIPVSRQNARAFEALMN